MKVLVAGGAGYIGSHVVKSLQAVGHTPIVYDSLTTGHRQAITDAELIVGDIRDRERLEAVLKRTRPDGAIHLAGVSRVGESMHDPAKYFEINTAGGIAFFDALLAANVPWVVFSSTAAVYGDPTAIPIAESHPRQPTNPYGESKRMLEDALGWYERIHGFRAIALRYFNAAGADPAGNIGEDHTPESHLVPIVMQTALGQRDALEVFGADYPTPDGTAIRDYVHVSDLASAHLLAAGKLAQGACGGCYNLGSATGFSVLQIIEAAKTVTGRAVPVRIGQRRAGDPPALVADAGRARSELGWKPAHNLESIIRTAWLWHCSHPHGYQDGR